MEEQNRSIEVTKLFKDVVHLLKQNMAKGFEAMGITAPQGMVIGTLSKSGKMKISDVSLHLGLSNSTVSGILDRLEKQEMVERIRSVEDKRVVYVSLTPKFQEMHQGFHKIMEENIGSILKKGTPEELDKIIEGMNILKGLLTDK